MNAPVGFVSGAPVAQTKCAAAETPPVKSQRRTARHCCHARGAAAARALTFHIRGVSGGSFAATQQSKVK